MNPYERPVEEASERIDSPAPYRSGQVGRELAAVRPGHPGASSEVFGHVYLP